MVVSPLHRAVLAGALAALTACGDDSASSSGAGAAGSGGQGAAGAGGPGGGGGAGGAGGSATGGSGGSGGSGAGVLGPCSGAVASDPDIGQALPETFDTSYVPQAGRTIAVAAGEDLQAAIDAAELGDIIEVEAGASFVGPFTLPAKSGSGTLVIRTSAPDADLPPPGSRIGPAFAGALPKILAPNTLSAFVTATGAHDVRLVGLEIAPVDEAAQIYQLVQLGDGSGTSLADVPHDIVLDRVYVHGTPNSYTKRGIGLDCARCGVVDSYVADCHAVGQDAQAIATFNGPGPIAILNNYLEGSGENVIFGGADPAIQDLVPSDIEIRQNHFTKPLTWKEDDPSYAGNHWSIKNLLEFKNARRVLVRCNVMEHNWADAQVGFAVLLTPRNQDGSAPWSGVSDVTIVDNVLRHVGSGINISGEDDIHPSEQTARVVIVNNVIHHVDRAAWGGDGRIFQVITPGRPVAGLKIEHNSAFVVEGNAALVMGDTLPVASDLFFRNNIVSHADYGVFGSGQGEGTPALDFFAPGYVFVRNAIIGGSAGSYPTDNFFPATPAEAGFVDYTAGDYRLTASSPLAGQATDGSDLGADIDAVEEATAGVD